MLTDRFGPPVELGPSLRDQVVGSLMAWQWHVVILSVIALGRRRRGCLAAQAAVSTQIGAAPLAAESVKLLSRPETPIVYAACQVEGPSAPQPL